MTLTIELSPEQEARLKAEATRNGLPMQEYALRRLLGDPTEAKADKATAEQRREPTGRGKLAHLKWSSEQFAQEKQQEIAREDRRR